MNFTKQNFRAVEFSRKVIFSVLIMRERKISIESYLNDACFVALYESFVEQKFDLHFEEWGRLAGSNAS